MFNKFIVNFCTLFNLGFIKFMPGTFGSLVSLPIGYIILKLFGFWVFILIITLLLAISYYAISKYLIAKKSKDPKEIIIDEFIGQFIALIFIPDTILGLLVSFLLFRFFDITKLYPVNKAEKIPGAIGVLADDVVAGLMTACIIIIFNIVGINL
jgi:phosphatidylglycerophosphatase A